MLTSLERHELPRLTLTAPIRQSRSGAGAFLGLASDGGEYWVKAINNPQGPRALVPEVICYGIGRSIGAPVCRNALIDIPDGLDWEIVRGLQLRGGVGHGSLNVEGVVVSDEWDTYSARDDNRNRQALILALWDLCMGGDPQWLHETATDYSIWSFDHGFWLAGEVDWSLDSIRGIGLRPWQYDIEPTVASAAGLRAAADRVQALEMALLRSIVDDVPVEWGTSKQELSSLAELLMARRDGVAERLRRAADKTRHG